MIKLFFRFVLFIVLSLSFNSCAVKEPESAVELASYPRIFPDYLNITIPVNIAPLRFCLEEESEQSIVVLNSNAGKFIAESEDDGFMFDENDWKQFIQESAGDSVQVKVYSKKDGEWSVYKPFVWYISEDMIDQWLVYRLIAPGYELWNKMGIYQRNISTYDEIPVLTNESTQNNCMNCHSFSNNSPENMSFHMRAKLGGTYIIQNDEINKVIPSEISKVKSFVYPSWHSSGRYIAYSCNDTKQSFHLNNPNRIEVYDLSSDILVYDTKTNKVIIDSLLFSPSSFETFPSFTPDGEKLLFCTAEKQEMPEDFDKVKYSICSISFDSNSGTFSNKVDTIYNSKTDNRSASFPKPSPDGRFMVFTKSEYGNFSIWHKDSDLYMYSFEKGSIKRMDNANSDDVESYHSWSSNSRWLVLSSRRMDGLYTSPYIVHINEEGECSKAFVVPQSKPNFYKKFMYSFNIPELIKEKIVLDKEKLLEVSR